MDLNFVQNQIDLVKKEFNELQVQKTQLLDQIKQVEERCLRLDGMFMAYGNILQVITAPIPEINTGDTAPTIESKNVKADK